MKISLFYKHVTVLDYAYLDNHKGLVGDAVVVNVEFFGSTTDEGVVFDFSHAKKKVKEIIDRDCDHRLVIPKNLAVYENGKVQLEYKYGLDEKTLRYIAPKEAVCEIPSSQVSNETLITYLEETVLKEMPKNIDGIKLSFTTEKGDLNSSFFNYTHGLKEHYGNCQRLMHGHRSTVEVFVNEERSFEDEKYLADDLFSGNIHFCKKENVANLDELKKACKVETLHGRYEKIPAVRIKYSGNQGEFEGTLPGESVYFMDNETTVENLSMEFCRIIKNKKLKTQTVRVHAYEGIGKGAVSTL